MTTDLDPEREAALRRRLASFGEAIVVPPTTDGSGEDRTEATDLALVRERPHRQRRPLVLAAAAATVTVAGAAGVLALADRDGADDTEATTATSAGTASAAPGDCEPRVAEDGVIASGPTEGGGWEVRVYGEPPHVGTAVSVDGAPAGGTMSDEMSRAPLVNNGAFALNAGLSDERGIVYGEIPRATAVVEVTTDEGGVQSACPVTVPTDELIAWFGLSLPPGVHPTGARALDTAGQALASGEIGWEPPPGIPDAGPPGAIGAHMTADPALVDLPLGGTEMELPPPVQRTEIASGTAEGSPWTLRAALDSDRADLELEYEYGAQAVQPGPTPLAEQSQWSLVKVDDRLIAWGPVPADATSVAITFDDGTAIDIPTVAALADGSARAFAGTLPVGMSPTAIEAHRADGSVALQAVDVAENVAGLAGDDLDGAGFVAVPPG